MASNAPLVTPEPRKFNVGDPHNSYTLPARLYFDPAVYEEEKEAIFYKSWNFVCSANQLEASGSYVTARIGDQNVAVVRGKDGNLRAFHNVCSHRAHELLSGAGRTSLIVCPYHAWAYELDGRLKPNRFIKQLENFNAEEFCLKPVNVEVFLGFVWLNIDLDAVPLAKQAPEFAHEIRRFVDAPETLKFAGRLTFEIKANWKNIVENFQECYHCPPAHQALVQLFDHEVYRTRNYEICSSHIAPVRESNSAYKIDSGAKGAQLWYGAWLLWPNVTLNVFPGRRNLSFMHIQPTGPETTLEHWDFFLEEKTPNEEELAAMAYIKNVLQPEDVGIVESVQRGLHSKAYSQGRLVVDADLTSNSEHGVHHFQKMVHQALHGVT